MSRHYAITLKQLRALSSVHERGSITMAAEKLNLTVPAVSTQLKLLAQNVGATLLARTSEGGTVLTPHGQQVLTAINKIDAALAHCLQSIDAMNGGLSGLVTLGVVSTGKYYAPSILALAKDTLPDVRIKLAIGNRQQMISGLEDHSIDIVIMGRPPRQPAVESISLGENPHVLIAPPEHPLAGKRNISLDILRAETMIFREPGSGTRILMERYLDRIREEAAYESIEFNSNEAIKQAVIAGLGIALISAHTVQDALKDGRIVTLDLPGLPIIRQWFLVRALSAKETPVSRRVRDFLEKNSKKFLPAYRDGR